jgi:hypothetical protein
MYLEILEKAVLDYVDKKNTGTITITLTPFIYKTLQLEMNSKLKINTQVPIEEVGFATIKLHGRTVTIRNDKELDANFEIHLVEKLSELGL